MIITTLNLIGIRLTRLHVETVSGKVPRTRSTSSNRLLLQCQTRLKKNTCASAVFFYKNLINKEMKNKGCFTGVKRFNFHNPINVVLLKFQPSLWFCRLLFNADYRHQQHLPIRVSMIHLLTWVIGCFLKRFSINVKKNARKNEDDLAER